MSSAAEWLSLRWRRFRADWHGWCICGAVLLLTVARSGITYSFGVFVLKLREDYHTPVVLENWIGTLSFTVSLALAPITVSLIRVCGPNGCRIVGLFGVALLSTSCLLSSLVRNPSWLFITYSLMYGVGSSCTYMTSSLTMGDWFKREHPSHVLATSLLLVGYPIGSLLFNPVNTYLLKHFGWRVTFRVTSALVAVVGIPCAWAFQPNTRSPPIQNEEAENEAYLSQENSVTSNSELNESEPIAPKQPVDKVEGGCSRVVPPCVKWRDIRQRPEIILWLMGICFTYIGFYTPFLNLAYYMELKGITPMRSSYALTLLSLAECTSYIIASFLGDLLRGRLIVANIVAGVPLALICLIWPLVDVSYGYIIFMAMVMGFCLGLSIVYTYAACEEVMQLPVDTAWSHTNLWSGIGILICPVFSGAIYDIRKSYDDMFLLNGLIMLVNVMLFSVIYARQRLALNRPVEYTELT